MKQSILKVALIIVLGTLALTSCKPASEVNNNTNDRQQKGREGGRERLTVSQVFSKMDVNKDELLSKSEVKGPLANNFSQIDANNDGYISKEELENAPKPERRQRPRN